MYGCGDETFWVVVIFLVLDVLCDGGYVGCDDVVSLIDVY